MAVAVGLGPVTGVPLPFVSMGGTSILFTSIAFGIILSVSADNDKKVVVGEIKLAPESSGNEAKLALD
jgi:cell division protein FtsW